MTVPGNKDGKSISMAAADAAAEGWSSVFVAGNVFTVKTLPVLNHRLHGAAAITHGAGQQSS
ncbi:MAG: hypothetical protein NC344_01815 [Bacteroidales bacterium]|nr:hypothetical protein [Bacteroidales bacterium]MCM1146570.1 hypothetical protein [Bacteroidales bacterium]MCM1205962.1 hypothetical protein [Bacillota bacterium]MCM1510158.1 hypothetical protein [Clostridium sp.]